MIPFDRDCRETAWLVAGGEAALKKSSSNATPATPSLSVQRAAREAELSKQLLAFLPSSSKKRAREDADEPSTTSPPKRSRTEVSFVFASLSDCLSFTNILFSPKPLHLSLGRQLGSLTSSSPLLCLCPAFPLNLNQSLRALVKLSRVLRRKLRCVPF